MKYVILLLIAFSLIGQGVAIIEADQEFIRGLNTGFHLGYLAAAGQTNITAANEYNNLVSQINLWMDGINYTGARLSSFEELPFENIIISEEGQIFEIPSIDAYVPIVPIGGMGEMPGPIDPDTGEMIRGGETIIVAE